MEELWVITDTNFLMVPGLFGVDIFSELDRILDRKYRLIVPEPVVEELNQLARGTSDERSAARIALALVQRGQVIKTRPPADDAILELARGKGGVVGTNDIGLRRELRARGVPVIHLRQKSHLAIDGKIS
ncbi:MAG: hypothetical protein U9M97_00060 [Candidatus Hadarchaeota archaeon]|nr:hypothetical protein [Candidatus Hadarchaeota archaeon]